MRAFVDDDGPFYPLGTSLLWALGGWMKGGSERDRVKQNLAFVADHDFDGVRVIYDVRWRNQPYGSDIVGTPQALADLLDCAYDEFGLRVKVTAHGGGGNPVAAARGIIQAVSSRRPKVLLLESVNEQNASQEEGIEAARILMTAGVPVSVGFGNLRGEPGNELGPLKDLGNTAGTNVDTLHTERGGGSIRQNRQCWDFHQFRRAADDGEPVGPESSVESQSDPFSLATDRAGSIICGGEMYYLHCGAGVYGVGYNGPTGYRHANLWEIPKIDEIMVALRNVEKAIVHTGVGNWLHTNTNIPMEVQSGHVDKQYFAINGKEFVAILTDTHGALTFKFRQPVAAWALYHPATGDRVESGSLNAYVLRGTLQ